MASRPSPAAIAAAIKAGRVFDTREELIETAKILEGYEFNDYAGGVWAFWDGETVGAIASEEFAKVLSHAVKDNEADSARVENIGADEGHGSEEKAEETREGGKGDEDD
jgi:hypothetical protein